MFILKFYIISFRNFRKKFNHIIDGLNNSTQTQRRLASENELHN